MSTCNEAKETGKYLRAEEVTGDGAMLLGCDRVLIPRYHHSYPPLMTGSIKKDGRGRRTGVLFAKLGNVCYNRRSLIWTGRVSRNIYLPSQGKACFSFIWGLRALSHRYDRLLYCSRYVVIFYTFSYISKTYLYINTIEKKPDASWRMPSLGGF